MSRQRFAPPHLSPIFLLSLLVLSVPATWAQGTLLGKQTSIQLAKYAVPFAVVPEAQTHLLPFRDKMPLSFTPNLGQTAPGLGFTSRGTGYDLLLPTNKPAELGAKANYWTAPPRWLTNVPDDVHPGTVYTRDAQYYGRRVPVVGQTILRIARQADSHPRATRVLRLIANPLFYLRTSALVPEGQRRETHDKLQAPGSNRRTGKAVRHRQGIQSAKWYAAQSRQRCRARRVCPGVVRRRAEQTAYRKTGLCRRLR